MSEYRLETEEDMSSYLDANFGHGRTATFTNTSGQTSTIELILNNEYFEEEFGVGVEGTQPIAFCNTLAVDAYKDVDGNTLVAAQTYKVVNVQKDNTGFTSLMLEES
jgi:hypothetical protein